MVYWLEYRTAHTGHESTILLFFQTVNTNINSSKCIIETVRLTSSYIFPFLTRHNGPRSDDKKTILTHRFRVSLVVFTFADNVTIYCWWHHNTLRDAIIVTRDELLCTHGTVIWVFIPICEATNGINTKITLGWAHKQFLMTVYTSFIFFQDIMDT